MSKVHYVLTLAISAALHAQAATFYVDASRADDTGAGTSWATAKKTIQAAVNMAVTGETVLVTNGVYNIGTTVTPGYALNNRLVITNDITVRSVNGPTVTVIEGSGSNSFNTVSAVRCVYMTCGNLEGFVLNGGATYGTGGLGSSLFQERYGGGVNMVYSSAGTTVSNCVIQYCRSINGGGAYGGTLNNCTLIGNNANIGGGSCAGTLNKCVLLNNSAHYGGGYDGGTPNSGGTLNHCTLSGNAAFWSGGGSNGGTLNHCTLSRNSALQGGGSANSKLLNCTLSGNSAEVGGGSFYSSLSSCTLARNSAPDAGGSYLGALTNCIVWANTDSNGSTNNHRDATFYYSCTTPLPLGDGNIDADPLLGGANDLSLQQGSPCIDTGDNGNVTWANDIAGNTRILNDTVDMGAYEYAFVNAPVPVPVAWLDQYPALLALAGGDYEAAALADMDGDGHVAWQEYVTGSVPTNSESVLRSLISVSNGAPWIAWTPDLGSARVYTVECKTNLTEGAWGPTNAASRFFRVRVNMP
jgi:hypothetical protein